MFLCHNNDCYKIPFFGPDMVLAIFSFLHLEWKIILISKSVVNWKVAKNYLSILLFIQVNEKSKLFLSFGPKTEKGPYHIRPRNWNFITVIVIALKHCFLFLFGSCCPEFLWVCQKWHSPQVLVKYQIWFGSLALTYRTLEVTSYPDSIIEILVLSTYLLYFRLYG